jgi:hypothetical protein
MILREGSNFGAPGRRRRVPSEDEQEELDWHVAKILQREHRDKHVDGISAMQGRSVAGKALSRLDAEISSRPGIHESRTQVENFRMACKPHGRILWAKWCMADLPCRTRMHAETEERRIDFLRTDLELCFTFAELAKTERLSGDQSAALRVLEKAEIGHATVARFLRDVNDPQAAREIEARLSELRARLDDETERLKAVKDKP